MKSSRHRRRSRRGSSMIELPFSLWLLFIGLAFPLIALSTMGLRYAFVFLAANDAVKAASRAPQFAADVEGNPVQLSAVHAAQSVASNTGKSFSGVTIDNVDVTILEFAPPTWTGANQPIGEATLIEHPKNTKLDAAYDPAHIYKIQVDVKATIDPLVTIPGVVGPYATIVSSEQVAENLQGLNQ